MRSRALLAVVAVIMISGWLGLFANLEQRKPAAPPSEEPAAKRALLPPRVLPGVMLDGTVQLPNQWQLRPAGRAIEVGDLPVNMAIHPSGQYLAVLHAGMREHEVVVVALQRSRQKIVSRSTVDQTFYGLCFSP